MEHRTSEIVPNLPIIITGLSGGGKSTVALRTQEHARANLGPDMQVVNYHGRLTTRPLRPGEQEGVDGYFGVTPEQMDERSDDLFFRYAKYQEQYAFSRSKLRDCLAGANVFLVGGEPDTAIAIKQAMNSADERKIIGVPSLNAVTVYIQRPLKELLTGILDREAGPDEKLRRVTHVVHKYEDRKPNEGPYDYLVMNGKDRLDEAVLEMVGIIQSERTKQMKTVFGSSYKSVALPADFQHA